MCSTSIISIVCLFSLLFVLLNQDRSTTAMASSAVPTAGRRRATVTFVRHAQSEENVKFESLSEGLKSMGKFSAPSWKSVRSGVSLLRTSLDSDLSPLGRRQVIDMNEILKADRYWMKRSRDDPPFVICHSPLKRARDTCLGILAVGMDTSDRLVELELLREATPFEHIFGGTLKKRIAAFEAWIRDHKSTNIIVVGHSQYFKKMLSMKSMMRNVDVWEAHLEWDELDGANCAWSKPKLLYRSTLANAHPLREEVEEEQEEEVNRGKGRGGGGNSTSSSSSAASPSTMLAPEVYNDLHDHLPTCRICTLTSSEAGEHLRMIKPCMCTGSSSNVHVECLQRWRSTSLNAYYKCQVCLYEYRVQRTWLANVLMSDNSIASLTSIMLVLMVLTSGSLLSALFSRLLNFDLALKIYRIAELDPWARTCLHNPIFKDLAALTWMQRMQVFRAIMLEQGAYEIILCSSITSWLFDTIACGLLFVGGVGMAQYLYTEYLFVVGHGFGDMHAAVNLGLLGLTMAANSSRTLARLAICLGSAYSTRETYLALNIWARSFAQRFGEFILEPNVPNARSARLD